jgi:hypothetical protein
MKPAVNVMLSILALTGCLLPGWSVISLAQGGPGLTIFSGVKSENQLPFRLDYEGRRGIWDRYRLRIPAKKVSLAIAQITISYPDYYNGEFDPKAVEVGITNPRWKTLKKVPIDPVNWDKENHVLQISLKEPVPAGSNVEVMLSNVKNPDFGGTYYFNCTIQTPGDVPLPRILGTWILSIG